MGDARVARLIPLSRAAIVAVGSELLSSSRLDTNSLFVTEHLNRLGIEVIFKVVVGDDRVELAHAVRMALARVNLLVVTGGLGPTDDDVTRDVVADVLGRSLREDTVITARIRRRFESRGMQMPEINRRQAMVPAEATVLENVSGTAPGLWLEHEGSIVLLLPGPPRELQPMMMALADGPLRARGAGLVLLRRIARITGRSESHTEEAVKPLYAQWRAASIPVAATILASLGQIELHLSAQAREQGAAVAALEAALQQVVVAVGRDVYSVDGRPLEQVVGDLLVTRGLHVAVAESCTGGLITSRLTDVPGSSRYVDRSVVTYSNDAKTALLGVPVELFATHGAVSEPVAVSMAVGMLARSHADVAIGVTGIAGPDGGTPDRPVGTVVVAVSTAASTRSRVFRFVGGREMVKFQAAQAALDMVRRMLEETEAGS
jgi:nicotinamide-nucleotide amidase